MTVVFAKKCWHWMNVLVKMYQNKGRWFGMAKDVLTISSVDSLVLTIKCDGTAQDMYWDMY